VNKTNDLNDKRRNLLKSAVFGGGALGATGMLPDKWIKPMVNSVVLPTHAATTGAQIFALTEPTTCISINQGKAVLGLNQPSVTGKITEMLMPSANAQVSMCFQECYLEQISGDLYRFVFYYYGSIDGDGSIDGEIDITYFADSQITLHVQATVPLTLCGEPQPDGADFTLLNVNPGVDASVKTELGVKTLLFNLSAVPPTDQSCAD